MVQMLTILLSLVGEPALAVGSAGACHGTSVAPGVLVFDSCTLAVFAAADVAVYVGPDGEEPLSGFWAERGARAGRVVVRFTGEHVQ